MTGGKEEDDFQEIAGGLSDGLMWDKRKSEQSAS